MLDGEERCRIELRDPAYGFYRFRTVFPTFNKEGHSIIEAMSNREQYSESIEMYLETILILSKDGKEVRQADIARALDFSRPTVHIAIKKMVADGLINMKDGLIFLQPETRKLAENIYERHKTFTRFLIHLGVDPDVAEMDACRIEHYVSEQTFQKIKEFCESGRCEGL